MKSARRRSLLIATVLSLVALTTATVTGAASSAGAQAVPEVPAATLQAAGVQTPSKAPALVTASSPAAAVQAVQAASRAVKPNTPPCAASVRACVSLGARKAWITDGNGKIVYGPVSVLGGRSGEPTPVGTFSVTNKVRDYHSREFDAPMPWSVFFYPGVAFHTGSLSNRSAGCLHLSNASAKRIFSILSPGDSVQVVR